MPQVQNAVEKLSSGRSAPQKPPVVPVSWEKARAMGQEQVARRKARGPVQFLHEMDCLCVFKDFYQANASWVVYPSHYLPDSQCSTTNRYHVNHALATFV